MRIVRRVTLLDDVFFQERRDPSGDVDRIGTGTVRARLAPNDSIGVLGDLGALRRADLLRATYAQLVELAARVPNLEVIVLRRPQVDDLHVLTRFPGLVGLRVDHATKVDALPDFARLPDLKCLALENLPKVKSLHPLGTATQLVEFRCATLFGSTKTQLIESLAPLESLRELRVARFEGVVARDRRLEPLWRLPNLQELRLPNFYPVHQVGRLVGARPTLTGWGVAATEPSPIPCKNCGQRKVQLIGATRGKFACPACESDLVIRHGLEFDRWRLRGQQEADLSRS